MEEGLESIEGLFPKHIRTVENKNEIDEIKKWEDKMKQKDLKYDTGESILDLLVKVFILEKLVYSKLIWIKSIY